jgi:hypothetical protein
LRIPAGRRTETRIQPRPAPRHHRASPRPLPTALSAAINRGEVRRCDTGSRGVDTKLPANAAMLAAKAPLAPRTTYNVRVSGYVQATKGAKWVQFRTRAWSFTTA